jgi:hypothetical protein
MILGRNGIIEKHELKNRQEKLLILKELLNNRERENQEYIDHLLRDPDAYKSLAEELGFMKNDTKLIRVIYETNNDLSNDIYLANRDIKKTKNDLMLENFEAIYGEPSFLIEIKTVITMIFFIVIAFFVIVTILSGEEESRN